MKKIIAIIGIIIFIIIGVVVSHPVGNGSQHISSVPPTAVLQKNQPATISYKGQNGQDALTLLKKQASVEMDHSGLVVGINGNKPTGHSYWAFYINGKLAPVGPAEYKTKNGDKIEWKIEKY